ncbi:rare lipoprotein A (peptidoglycan hydrolase) [Bradyrhizobium sp. USDA 4486]
MRRSEIAVAASLLSIIGTSRPKRRYVFTFVLHVSACAGTRANEFALSISVICARPIMRLLCRMIAIATMPAWIASHASPAVAQSFDDRWSIIPKAHAEPAPDGLDQTKKDDPQSQPPTTQQAQPAQEPSNDHPAQSFNRVFSGKASYYSYAKGRTASGSSFNRNLLTAAHRNLPFGTKLRVTHGNRSVIVTVNDRGPWIRGRILDLSLAAAHSLGITDRGVAQVRAEVL